MLIPIVPFALVGELPGERWLALSEGDALRFGATGAVLLSLDVLLPIPSSIVGTLLGGRLGFGVGVAWTWLGLTTGLIAGYALGRLVPARFASGLQSARAQLADAPTLGLTFISRPVPVLAEAVAIAAGVERVNFPRFFAAGALGNAFYALVLNANGAALLPRTGFATALVLPMLLPVLGYLWWKRRSRTS